MEQDTNLPPEAEKLLRIVHEIYTYQGGGDHPNTADLSKCGACMSLVEAFNGSNT